MRDPAAQLDLEPLWVGDSSTREWNKIRPTQFWRDCITWLNSQGLSEHLVTRVEVYVLDAPFAKVWRWVLENNGQPAFCENGRDLRQEQLTIPLTTLPPEWPS